MSNWVVSVKLRLPVRSGRPDLLDVLSDAFDPFDWSVARSPGNRMLVTGYSAAEGAQEAARQVTSTVYEVLAERELSGQTVSLTAELEDERAFRYRVASRRRRSCTRTR